MKTTSAVFALALLLVGCGAAAPSAPPPSAPPPSASTSASDADSERARVELLVDAEVERLRTERGATRVSIVVLDVEDGRVLAAHDAGSLVDPASTIKPLTVAAALEAGLDPEARFDGEGGSWGVEGGSLLDAHPRASLDATDVLVHSSNVGAAKIAQRVGPQTVRAMLAQLGFDRAIGDSQPGTLPPTEVWSTGQGLRLSVGIGLTTSPMHIAAGYAALARDGVFVEPTVDGSGPQRRVMSADTAQRVLGMLEVAVREGTGQAAALPDARVAGKTGTAWTGPEDDRRSWATFVGVIDAGAPRRVIYVGVEVPGEAWGGNTAAPSFARLAEGLR